MDKNDIMSEKRGKLYLLLSIIIIIATIALVEEKWLTGIWFFVAGWTAAWSYWYWWRQIIWKKQLKEYEEKQYQEWVARYESEKRTDKDKTPLD